MKTLKTNTALFPCVDLGMYESFLDMRHYFDDNIYEIKRATGINVGEMDWNIQKYKKDILESADNFVSDVVLEFLKPFGVSDIRMTGIDSPREYNFRSDQGEITISLTDDFADIMKVEIERMRGNSGVDAYIRNNWHSRSGFWSFMPHNLDEILDFEEDEERCISAYLTLLCLSKIDAGLYDGSWQDEFITTLDIYGIENYLNEDDASKVSEAMKAAGAW